MDLWIERFSWFDLLFHKYRSDLFLRRLCVNTSTQNPRGETKNGRICFKTKGTDNGRRSNNTGAPWHFNTNSNGTSQIDKNTSWMSTRGSKSWVTSTLYSAPTGTFRPLPRIEPIRSDRWPSTSSTRNQHQEPGFRWPAPPGQKSWSNSSSKIRQLGMGRGTLHTGLLSSQSSRFW